MAKFGLINVLDTIANSTERFLLASPGFLKSYNESGDDKINKVYEYNILLPTL